MDMLSGVQMNLRISYFICHSASSETSGEAVCQRHIAGEGLDDAVRVVKDIHSKQMMATMDVLGENVSDTGRISCGCQRVQEVLHSIHKHHLGANLSIG
jgi:hypothetical protein